jgi:hypothetical protein
MVLREVRLRLQRLKRLTFTRAQPEGTFQT